MFTGIIQEIGIVVKKNPHGAKGISLEIASKKLKPKIGASISVNGACLTVTQKKKGTLLFDIVHETMSRTNLGKLEISDRVNLEPSMRTSDLFDGHFVMGHVDSAGVVKKISQRKELTIAVPKKLMKFITEKGSIALNGVSLTIARTWENTFIVALIPFTLKQTNLGALKKGDTVNIEIDLIARYLARI